MKEKKVGGNFRVDKIACFELQKESVLAEDV